MKQIQLSQNLYALVDDDKYEELMVYRWRVQKIRNYYYPVATIQGKMIYMHRWLMGVGRQFWVDHINGNTLDNRLQNLRACNRTLNLYNSNMYKNNRTGYKGVIALPSGRFRARLTLNKKKIELGVYSTATEAANAYDKGAARYFGEFARPNKSSTGRHD